MTLGQLFGPSAGAHAALGGSDRWPTTTARPARGRCSSACAASRATVTTSRRTRSSAAPRRWSSSARSDLDVPQVAVSDVRAAMAPAAALLHGDPTARLARRRHHRNQRQDDDGVPRRARCSRPAGGRTGLLGTVEQIVGGGAQPAVAHDAGGDRPPGDVRARCSTPATRACVMEVSSHALELRARRRDPLATSRSSRT